MHLWVGFAQGVQAADASHLRLVTWLTGRMCFRRLVEIQYSRDDASFTRGSFRVRGDVIEIRPAYEEEAIRDRVVRGRCREPLGDRSADGQGVAHDRSRHRISRAGILSHRNPSSNGRSRTYEKNLVSA